MSRIAITALIDAIKSTDTQIVSVERTYSPDVLRGKLPPSAALEKRKALDAQLAALEARKSQEAQRAAKEARKTQDAQRAAQQSPLQGDAQKIYEGAQALGKYGGPLLEYAMKLLTGGTDSWSAFKTRALSALSGDVTASQFASLLSEFVSERAKLAQQGVKLAPVEIPPFEETSWLAYLGIPLVLAVIGGVIYWRFKGG